MKKYFIIVILFFTFLFSGNTVQAYGKPSEMYPHKDYVIDAYHVDIKVNENNTFDITETITAYFNVPKHGIFRTIPLRNEVTRLDGTTTKNRVQITNVEVSDEVKISRENGDYILQIGSPNYTITGKKKYTISYNYNIGKDPLKDIDEFYYNIIGTEWDTYIGNVTFKITMPKEFDKSKLGFSAGVFGTVGTDKINYNVDGNVITGSYNIFLSSGEGLTVRLELPEGYFVGAGFKLDLVSIIPIILSLSFVLIAYLLWNKFGKDEEVVETVEFYPPEGFNSLEVGQLYKGKASQEDVVSLLIYLANKGYIKITETEDKSFFSNGKGFIITKLKEYDGKNEHEKTFLTGLFDLGVTEKQSVTKDDLYNEFYVTVNEILSDINDKENKEKIFEKSSLGKRLPVILMIIATFILITIRPVMQSDLGIDILPVAIIFPGIGFSVLFGMMFGKNPISVKIAACIWGLGFVGIPWSFMVLPSLLEEPLYLVTYIIGLICILAMVLLFKVMPKRTTYGNDMLGRIKGFKDFLETAEKEKLEAMVLKNPTYFYDILPYTYVLGVSDKWISKFESIAMQAPDWYDGPDGFDSYSFGRFIDNTMTSASRAMTSSPSSSGSGGGGGFSGGGSSGGGSGGGGGGSW